MKPQLKNDMSRIIRIGLITSAAILTIKTLNILLVYHYFNFDKYLAAVAVAFFLAGYFFSSKKEPGNHFSPALLFPKNGLEEEVPFNQLRQIRYSLTNRELTIFRFIASGCTNKEIAHKLNVEVSTVKTHINHLFSKINCKNRKEAVEKWDEMTKCEILS